MSAEKQQDNSKKKVPGRPFKPGQSGNPAGRPPNAKTIPEMLRQIGDEECKEEEFAGMTNAEAVQTVVWKCALAGKQWAVEFLANRTEGKVIEKHEVSGKGPIAMELIVSRKKDEIASDDDGNESTED